MGNVVTRDARKEQAADVAQLCNKGNYVTRKDHKLIIANHSHKLYISAVCAQ